MLNIKMNEIKAELERLENFKEEILWVVCSECKLGGNGTDKNKYSSGGKCKKFKGTGCFSGTLMEKYTDKL